MRLFQEKKRHQLGMGGEKRLNARKTAGKLNVRERIDYFFDPGTFQELGLFTHSAIPGMAERTPTDGKIIGFGLVEGRPVGTVANDMTILGAYKNSRFNTALHLAQSQMEYVKEQTFDQQPPYVYQIIDEVPDGYDIELTIDPAYEYGIPGLQLITVNVTCESNNVVLQEYKIHR